eukprot:755785-Hanusia_phi.AAC.1
MGGRGWCRNSSKWGPETPGPLCTPLLGDKNSLFRPDPGPCKLVAGGVVGFPGACGDKMGTSWKVSHESPDEGARPAYPFHARE